LYSERFHFWPKPLENRRFYNIFVTFPEQKQEIMKKLIVSLLCVLSVFLLSCTDDETIEEEVYKQDNLRFDTWASGEEGDQDLDRNIKD
jgi:hypothetical protein